MSGQSSSTREVSSRRTVLQVMATLGIGTAIFQRSLAAQLVKDGRVTAEMVSQSEWIAGLELTDAERQRLAEALNQDMLRLHSLRNVAVGYDVPPALYFSAQPGESDGQPQRNEFQLTSDEPTPRPTSDDDLAFLSVSELAPLMRTQKVSSVELTKLYLSRLRKHDPLLKSVVTYTDDLALRQAAAADHEIAAGRYRGPLHGIPWGAKDLIAYPGYKTTWGAGVFQEQRIETKATVAQRLDDAGAVLVAKLSLGALAWGDEWFGGLTRNPWNPSEGSSGSSAGSASAVAAGLVGFAIGSETLGSIVSPCRRCSVPGLRPTFGRVSRHGCMTLAWSMDKLGPIARSMEDCALIFGAIHGADGRDATAVSRPFEWPTRRPLSTFRVGYFGEEGTVSERADLRVLKELGVTLVPIQLPTSQDASLRRRLSERHAPSEAGLIRQTVFP